MANEGKKWQFTSDMIANSSATVKRNKGHNTICPICEESFKEAHEYQSFVKVTARNTSTDNVLV